MPTRNLAESVRTWFGGGLRSSTRSKFATPDFVSGANPTVPSRFHIIELLGRGGMGKVYRAYDSAFGREVALKCLYQLHPLESFHLKEEFRSLTNVLHPNLVELFDLVVDDLSCFFTMELVRGIDFFSYVQGVIHAPGTTREAAFTTVYDVAAQLVAGIGAVHAANKLHRDIKPTNILVTDAGRVVLLDFGLVAAQQRTGDPNKVRAGTLEYMAPEQALGDNLTLASDWYAFGVTLYQAIGGALPCEGTDYEIVRRKTSGDLKDLGSHLSGVPRELEELIHALLRYDPSERPGEADLLPFFRSFRVATSSASSAPISPDVIPSQFVNRIAERSVLLALLNAEATSARLVRVTGSSGIGKSELLRQVLRSVEGRDEFLVLCGRCHPHEAVAFNAFDGVIDELAKFLRNLEEGELPLYVPADADALLRVFPVIASVDGIPNQTAPRREEGGAQLRREAARSLKQLLRLICVRRRLIIWIDDVQWGDSDSGNLLQELLRSPDMPQMLLILSYRSDDRGSSACLEALDQIDESLLREGHELALEPLLPEDSRELVRRWANPAKLRAAADYDVAAQAAGGLPFMLCEVGRHLARHPEDPLQGALPLGEILRIKLRDIPAKGLEMMEICAVAGGPTSQDVILEAAAAPDGKALLRRLEKLGVIRTASVADGTTQIYHERLRIELLNRMGEGVIRARHRALGLALVNQKNAQLTAIVDHFLAADDRDSAKRYVLPAAKAADAVFAFEHAARLYQRAIELDCSDVDRTELYTSSALALMNAGRARDAARAFKTAANLAEARPGTDPEHLLELRRRAAEQFLQCGYNTEAIGSLDPVLRALGVKLPPSRAAALTRAALVRAGQLSDRIDGSIVGQVDVAAKRRAEVLFAVTIRLGMIDHARMGLFSALCVNEARRSRDASILTRAYSLDSGFNALIPARFFLQRAEKMNALAASLCTDGASIHDQAMVAWGFGAVNWMQGRWLAAASHFDRSVSILQTSKIKMTFDLALCDLWRLAALAHLGEVSRMRERMLEILDESDHLDDRYMGRAPRIGQQTICWLADDRPEYAIELADEARRYLPDEYSTPHFHYFVSMSQALIYQGRGLLAWQRCVEEWPQLKGSFLLTVASARDELHQLRARCALAAAEEITLGGSAEQLRMVPALLKDARAQGQTILRHAIGCSTGWAELIFAGADCLEQPGASVQLRLRKALADFERNGMALYSAASAHALAASDAADSAAREQALARMRLQSVTNPEKMVRLLAPGLALQ